MPAKEKPKSISKKKFYKSRKDKMIDGVCGGLAEFLGVDGNVVRVVWLLSIFIKGLGIIAYVLAMIIVPVNPEHKNLNGAAKRKRNPAFFWGLFLILLGFVFLWNHLDWPYHWNFPWNFRFFPFWGISWEMLWPLALIFLGVAYIIYVLRKEKREAKPKEKGGDHGDEEKKLVRMTENKMIGGVCSGFGRHFNIDTTIIRIALVILALATDVLLWIVIYAFLFIVIPQAEVDKAKVEKQ